MAKVRINAARLEAAAKQAFKEVVLELDQGLKAAITDSVWAWPNPPSPRDIVDSGALRDAQQLQFQSGGTVAIWRWGVSYDLIVHEGYTARNGNEYPGRPWTEMALKKVRPQQRFATLLPNYL